MTCLIAFLILNLYFPLISLEIKSTYPVICLRVRSPGLSDSFILEKRVDPWLSWRSFSVLVWIRLYKVKASQITEYEFLI